VSQSPGHGSPTLSVLTRPAAPPHVRGELLALLVASALLFSAAPGLSLLSMDDAFYARIAIEAERSGRFFTMTWAEQPNFQKPPLQSWLVGRFFAVFGEHDLSARLPSILMALGVLAMTYRIGALTVGPAAALTGVAGLALSPYFCDHARRVMQEIPSAFWTALAMLIFLESRRRPRLMLLFALPLGAAILTKSLLGLVPLLVVLTSAIAVPVLRGTLRNPWTWAGILGGLALAAIWTIEQGWQFGSAALREHYLREVGPRAVTSADPLRFLLGYPVELMDSFQPVALPAGLGAFVLWRNRAARGETGLALVIWAFVPMLALNVLSGRAPRYIFPLFPSLALCAGFWLAHVAPAVAAVFRRWIAPALLVIAAVILWSAPDVLQPLLQSARDQNHDIKRSRQLLRELIPADEPVAFLGGQYWGKASPLLYYAERRLEPPGPSAAAALERASSRPSRLLLCDRVRLHEIDPRVTPYRVVFESRDWVLLQLVALGAERHPAGHSRTRRRDGDARIPGARRRARHARREPASLTSHGSLVHPAVMKRIVALGLLLLALLTVMTPAAAQGQRLQVEGWVQWLSAQRLQLVLDNGLSISIDLTRVPQDQYRGLSPGMRDRVSVIGVVSQDNRRLIASSVTRIEGWSESTTQSP
jgi:4-amino-4-deoxy-L-arabinose transferase-like glycosyltransferase